VTATPQPSEIVATTRSAINTRSETDEPSSLSLIEIDTKEEKPKMDFSIDSIAASAQGEKPHSSDEESAEHNDGDLAGWVRIFPPNQEDTQGVVNIQDNNCRHLECHDFCR